jgi:hypothetical protein
MSAGAEGGHGHLAVTASANWPEADDRPIRVVVWSTPSGPALPPPAGDERWIALLIE